ncbi:MAG TPA: tyrosine-type recombinase/integrase [Cyclobacteriaceae bacterium]|nr:tyrosine-type recombinase/integrase [Cyclobacteriaceae bacterium]
MAVNQQPCSPLDFDTVFLRLLADMDGEIHRIRSGERSMLNGEKMVRYQTLIAAGGYFGPRAKELLSLKWFDIIGKKDTSVWQFKTSRKRKVYFSPSFIKLAERNYKIIDPINVHHLVLHRKSNPMTPVATRDFNENLSYYFQRFGVETENTSSHTLRKTFMNHAWQQLGGDERAYLTVGKMMGYASKEQVMDYLGHTQRQIREAVLRFK